MSGSSEEDETEVISTNKRRKIHEFTEGETNESSGNSDYSDASIEVVGQRETSIGDDDDDDLDLLQALDETRDELELQRPPLLAMGGNNDDHGESEASTELTTRGETQVTEGEAETDPQLEIIAEPTFNEPIDLEEEAMEQQVVEIPAEEAEEPVEAPTIHKAVRDYRCPICFEPPETAVMTPCGHIFCVACLFQMVNSSRGYRKNGHCALCRSEVKFRDIRMVVLRKRRVSKLP